MSRIIDMRGIHRIFETEAGFAHVLHAIDFTVERGEFVAITGPSGSGIRPAWVTAGRLRAGGAVCGCYV